MAHAKGQQQLGEDPAQDRIVPGLELDVVQHPAELGAQVARPVSAFELIGVGVALASGQRPLPTRA